MTQELIRKIKEAANEYEERFKPDVLSLIQTVEDIDAIKNLAGHFLVKEYLKNLKEQVNSIESDLGNKKSDQLSDRERDNLIDRKFLFTSFISMFDVDQRLKDIENQVNEL